MAEKLDPNEIVTLEELAISGGQLPRSSFYYN